MGSALYLPVSVGKVPRSVSTKTPSP